MSMELFDRVNEQDEIIGTTFKKEAHSEGYVHRVAAVYVFDSQGCLYVQHHKKANMFDHSVGGHVTKGEGYDEAARREADEELGLKDNLTSIAKFYSDETYCGAPYRHMFALYTCTPSEDWKFESNDEVGVIEPMTLEDIVEKMNKTPRLFTPGFLNSMEFYLQHTGSDLKLDLTAIRQNGY